MTEEELTSFLAVTESGKVLDELHVAIVDACYSSMVNCDEADDYAQWFDAVKPISWMSFASQHMDKQTHFKIEIISTFVIVCNNVNRHDQRCQVKAE